MLHSKRNSKPKSQSDAMIQVAKSIENSTRQQEENKDIRLQAFLASERKRDDIMMFFAYQRDQAEANRKHEMMMAQILLQATSNVRPQYANSCMPPASQPLPPTGSFSGWNNANSAIGGELQDPFIVICDHVKNSCCLMYPLLFDLLILKQVMFQCLRLSYHKNWQIKKFMQGDLLFRILI